jgi:hypothetical protein
MGPFIDGWEIEDVEAVIAHGIPEELLYVPIVVSLAPPDCEWAQEVCIGLSNHPHFNVRGNAILGFGHLARTCRRLDLERVLPIVSAALKHEHDYAPGHAEDAAANINHYLKTMAPSP